MMPDDAEATTRELGMSPGWSEEDINIRFDEIKAWADQHGYNALTGSDAFWLITWVDGLRSLNSELLAVVKRTLSLFEALNLDVDECARIRDLVGRASDG